MKKEEDERLRKLIKYILLSVIFVVPLITTLKFVPVPEALKLLYNKETHADFFVYAKAQFLHFGTILVVIITIIFQILSYKKEEWKQRRSIYILMGMFASSTVISFILSTHKVLAWAGQIDRYEGTLTWLCYIGLSYSVYSIVKTKKDVFEIVSTFVISASISSIIGALQLFGYDLFKSTVGRKILLGKHFSELSTSVKFNFPEGRVTTTVYNPNYVGTLIALSLPLTVYCILNAKRWWTKLFFIMLSIPQLLSLYGSESSGGFFAVVSAIIMVGLYCIIKYSMHKSIIVGLISGGIIIGLFLWNSPLFFPYYNKIMDSIDANNEYLSEFKEVEYEHPIIRYTLQDNSKIELIPEANNIQVIIDGNMDVTTEGNFINYMVEDEKYIKKVLYDFKTGLVRIIVRNLQTNNRSESRFNYYYSGHFSVGDILLDEDNVNAKSSGWIKNERMMSGRGYIWNRTIPLILSKPLFGYGADTFVINYPQVDLLDKFQILWDHKIIVDKPHSFFLNLFVNFGGIGTILFFVLTVVAFFKSKFDFLVIPILSYFVVGLVNDSVVFGTYMIFIILGILLTITDAKRYKREHI